MGTFNDPCVMIGAVSASLMVDVGVGPTQVIIACHESMNSYMAAIWQLRQAQGIVAGLIEVISCVACGNVAVLEMS